METRKSLRIRTPARESISLVTVTNELFITFLVHTSKLWIENDEPGPSLSYINHPDQYYTYWNMIFIKLEGAVDII